MRSTGRFRRSDRLLLSRDFQRVARHGSRVASRHFVMLVAPARSSAGSKEPARRLGVTASRKVGTAVQRNRVKRGIREWFRQSRGEFEEDVDIVVIARRGAADLDTDQLRAQLGGMLVEVPRRAGPDDA